MRWLLTATVVLLTALLPARGEAPALLAPADAVVLTIADLATLDAANARSTRYLWLPNLPPEDRRTWRTVLAGHCNQLSRSSDLTVPREVKGSAGHLLAVNLLDYGWKAETWDQFAASDHTFYATVVTETAAAKEVETEETIDWKGGPFFQGGYHGEYLKPGRYRVKVTKAVAGERAAAKTRVPAPWLVKNAGQKKAVETLLAATGAKAPIVNAFVFLDNTAASGDGRRPSYYDVLGIADEAGFQKLLGVDVKQSVEFSTDLLAAIGLSGVTQEPRAIQRLDKIGGAYWRSFDVLRGEATDDRNALRILGSDENGKPVLRFDASEQYGHLPNGLWAFGLFDKAGVRQDSAPERIAHDPVAVTRNNHRVVVCVSCVRCHADGGLQDLDDWVRNFPPELDLLAGDRSGKKAVTPEDARRLRRQYGRRLEPFLKADRERYAAALKEVTGLVPEKYAAAFARAWSQAADAPVDLDYAARETGEPEARIVAAVRHQAALGKLDPVLAVFALPAAKRKSIPLAQWREAYPLLQQYLAELPAN